MVNTDSRNWWITVGGGLVIAMIILLVIAFLPPFRLIPRLQSGSYALLTAKEPVVSHDDGLHVVASPTELEGDFGVQLDSVPRLNFLEGSAGDELKRAAEALPAHLIVKSPYYKIETRGDALDSTLIAVDIPNNAEPWETLDLYTWTGEGWEWVGGQVDADRNLIVAKVGQEVPQDVVVMQASAISPAVLIELPPGQTPSVAANSGATHLLPRGLQLGEQGTIVGDQASLPLPSSEDTLALIPTLRNWSEESESSNQALLADLLANPEARQAHINNILALVVGQGYAGIDLDYRGVSADWRESFADFVADLASALHKQGKVLTVAVDAASPMADGGWDGGGYDWYALGQAADMLRVPFPPHPDVGDGDWGSYLTWALSQVSRYKLAPTFAALSYDRMGDQVTQISLGEALAPLSAVTGLEEGAVLEPGEIVTVKLGNEALSTLQRDEGSQTYRYTYHDDGGNEHQVTLVTAASLGQMMDWAMRYHLGGAHFADVLEPQADPALVSAVRQFATQAPSGAPEALQVVWTVRSASGEELARVDEPLDAESSFEWTAPETAGEYVIGAVVASQNGVRAVNGNGVAVNVVAPTPTPTPTLATRVTSTQTVTETTGGGESAAVAALSSDCLDSVYVADVTVQDNTRFEKEETFVKTWRVQNNGSCPWPEGTALTFVSGDTLNGPQSVDVGTLSAGETTDISVDMASPADDGNYKGVWRLVDDSGDPFGTQLTVVIRVGEEQAAAPPSAPPPSGGGGPFELGGHIRTWNHVAEMKYAGMSWAKVQVHYNQDASGIIQTAHSNGLKIQLSALGTPDMVLQPNFHADYSAWVAGLASAGADAIEVWNEPNIDREWQVGHIDPGAYTQLLCASYSAIKNANPGTAVISAAPAPTGYFGGCSANGCDDLPWLQGMYNAGAASCMDYIGAHHNAGATSPSATSGHPADSGGGHHSWYFLPQTQLYYNTFGGARKLFYTEMGYASQEGLDTFSDDFAWARGTNNAQQAAWLAEAVQLSRSTGMVANIIVWNIDFPRYGYDPQDGYAIVRPGGGCPACDALHNVMQ